MFLNPYKQMHHYFQKLILLKVIFFQKLYRKLKTDFFPPDDDIFETHQTLMRYLMTSDACVLTQEDFQKNVFMSKES